MKAPVALFTYNRPSHVRRTIEALLMNRLADQTDVYVFSDGPKGKSDYPGVAKVRDYLQSVTGFKSLQIKSSVVNRGLAASIIEGVTEIVKLQGRVIVLEDDLVSSPFFLEYMNDALDGYADNEQVMHISGYMYPVEREGLPETFFLRFPSPWGWATWSRAWKSFEKNVDVLYKEFSKAEITRFNLDGANDFWEQVRHNRQGKANTWAIFWYASIFKQNALCLFPRQSLVENIGQDGTGVHCLKTDVYKSTMPDRPVEVVVGKLMENPLACSRVQAFYRENRLNRWLRLVLIYKLRMERFLSRLAARNED